MTKTMKRAATLAATALASGVMVIGGAAPASATDRVACYPDNNWFAVHTNGGGKYCFANAGGIYSELPEMNQRGITWIYSGNNSAAISVSSGCYNIGHGESIGVYEYVYGISLYH